MHELKTNIFVNLSVAGRFVALISSLRKSAFLSAFIRGKRRFKIRN